LRPRTVVPHLRATRSLTWQWLHEAPVYGIPFGARNFSIYIELPDDFPLLPDGYRQFLRHTHNLQHHVQAREFARLALRHRPAWLIELPRNFAPDARHTQPLHGEMAALFKSLGVRRRWWPAGDGTPPPPGGDGIEYGVSPQIVPLCDETDIRERGMEHKAARFYSETHQLFVNTGYASFVAFRESLEQEYASLEDLEQMRRVALTTTEQLLFRQVCRKLVFGLSKRGVWHGWEVDQSDIDVQPDAGSRRQRSIVRGSQRRDEPPAWDCKPARSPRGKRSFALRDSNGGIAGLTVVATGEQAVGTSYAVRLAGWKLLTPAGASFTNSGSSVEHIGLSASHDWGNGT
jgi:hypothetical protein